MPTIGVLTSGGDCPGLNAVIRSIVITGDRLHGARFVGFRDGWRGVLDAETVPLDLRSVRGLSRQGGTVLGSSRDNPYEGPRGGPERIDEVMQDLGVGALLVIGGGGTMATAARLVADGIPIIGVPKTIDNDLQSTDFSFGFDTAVKIATDAIDRIRTTADSHHRCLVVEVMGRNAGWIALHAGMAAEAHAILTPERPESLERICDWVTTAHGRGQGSVVVVAEGFRLDDPADPQAGAQELNRLRPSGIGGRLTALIEERTGIESRFTSLGFTQRGGEPSAFDRVLATRLGMAAIAAAIDHDWGSMVSTRGTEIVRVRMTEVIRQAKLVPDERYTEAALLFG